MSFKVVKDRAARRKGGEAALQSLLPEVPDQRGLAHIPNDRFLSVMARCVFNSGFNWRVIAKKWPGFEEAFLGFAPDDLLADSEALMDSLVSDTRIVRHGAKIKSVFENARFITEISAEHGSFGQWLSNWPVGDQIGLLGVLKKRGNRLGGNTGQYVLRFAGYDGFVLGRDVIAALKADGLEIADTPSSKRDMAQIQERFNDWHAETGLPYTHLSRIAALSIGSQSVQAEAGAESDEDKLRAIADIPQ